MRTFLKRSVVVGAVVAAAGLLAACGTADVDETTRDDSGAVTEGGELGVYKLRVGDCLDLGDSATQEEGEVDSFQAIPCDKPHQGEVFLVNEKAFSESAWPGEQAVGDKADERCGGGFEAYVGADYDSTDLDFFALFPTEGAWELGDRGVACVVVRPTEDGQDVELVTGSLKDKG